MSVAVYAVRRHPAWLIPLVVALAVGAVLLLPAVRSHAAPPSNDTCASPTTLVLGTSTTGDTTNATNDYNATVTPTTTPSTQAVPAAGPDVVYKLTLTSNELAQITVKAQFQVSTYATPVKENGALGTIADCGKAFVPTGIEPFANDGGRLVLFGPSGGVLTDWYIVVDGWTATDKGPFEIGTSLASEINAQVGDNTEAVVGSLLPHLTKWNYSESSTRSGFREFITLESATAQTVSISYFLDPTSPGFTAGMANPTVTNVVLPAGTRVTVIANDPATGGVGQNLDFAFEVDGTFPVQVAAALYSNRDVGLGVPINGLSDLQGQHN
jgi:hypothetical protein